MSEFQYVNELKCVSISMCVRLCPCEHVHKLAHVCVCVVFMCIRKCVCVCVCVCVRVHTHATNTFQQLSNPPVLQVQIKSHI